MQIEIYGQKIKGDDCPWCKRAVTLCENFGYAHVYRDMTANEVLQSEFLTRSNNAGTVPQIFVGDTHVGGYQEFETMVANGTIQQLIGGK
jgi:glutaredoxin 3